MFRAVSRHTMAPRDPRADSRFGVVLRRFGFGDAIEAARYPLEGSLVHQAP